MGYIIHRKDTEHGPRYRVWSTYVDQYVWGEASREEMVEHLLWEDYGGPANPEFRERALVEIEQRLKCVDKRGTSKRLGRPRDTSKWEEERCLCGGTTTSSSSARN